MDEQEKKSNQKQPSETSQQFKTGVQPQQEPSEEEPSTENPSLEEPVSVFPTPALSHDSDAAPMETLSSEAPQNLRKTIHSKLTPEEANALKEPMAGLILTLQMNNMAAPIAENVWVVTPDVFDNWEKLRREYAEHQANRFRISSTGTDEKGKTEKTLGVVNWRYSTLHPNLSNQYSSDTVRQNLFERLSQETANTIIRNEYGEVKFRKERNVGETVTVETHVQSNIISSHVSEETMRVRITYVRARSLAAESERALAVIIRQQYKKFTAALRKRAQKLSMENKKRKTIS